MKRILNAAAYVFPVAALLMLVWVAGAQAREIERLRHCVRVHELREKHQLEMLDAVSPALLPNLRNNRRVTCEFPEDQKN